MQLLRDKRVLFAGYKVPHPLQSKFELKVRTIPESSPEVALKTAIDDLQSEFESLQNSLARQAQPMQGFGREY
jgi:DNA-directed RNA polymerase II subunit RPB11